MFGKFSCVAYLTSLLPIITWLPRYKCRTALINNLFAGFTVAIPEVTYLCFFPVLLYEKEYQKKNLEMVPSDNYTSLSVLDCMGSCLHNKYSEDQPGQRYYCGNEYVDQLERLAQPRGLALYNLVPDQLGRTMGISCL